MKRISLDRRQFLTALGLGAAGLGGAALGLPGTAGWTSRAQAGGSTAPTRVIFWISPHGTVWNGWNMSVPGLAPSGTSTAALAGIDSSVWSTILAPLEPHRSDLLIIDNVDMESAHHGPGDGHQTGMGSLWTGIELLAGTQFTGGGDSGTAGWGGGPSVDQHIAKTVGATTKLPSLELGVQDLRRTGPGGVGLGRGAGAVLSLGSPSLLGN